MGRRRPARRRDHGRPGHPPWDRMRVSEHLLAEGDEGAADIARWMAALGL
jgi:hypothetical protein